jgi:hypothetical protein
MAPVPERLLVIVPVAPMAASPPVYVNVAVPVRTLFPTIEGVPVDASTETVPVVVPESVVVCAVARGATAATNQPRKNAVKTRPNRAVWRQTAMAVASLQPRS